MKILLIKPTIFLLLFNLVGIIYSQQIPQSSQYQQSLFVINPASTGADDNLKVNMNVRKQWVGLGNEPTTMYFGAEKAIKMVVVEKQPLALRTSHNETYHVKQNDSSFSKIKHGVGAFIMTDKYGAFNKNIVNLSYAAHYGINENLTASAGLNLGCSNFQFDQSKAVPNDPTENTYADFINQRSRFSMLDLNLGVFLYSKDYYFGYSTNQLLGDKLAFKDLSSSVLVLHHTLIAGYKATLNDKLALNPTFILKSVKGAPATAGLNLKADIQNKYYGGLGYRTGDAIIILLGFKPSSNFNVGYSFDYNTSSLRRYSSGGHELNLTYNFN